MIDGNSASGGSYVGFGNNNSYVEWDVNAVDPGPYMISFRYALDSEPRPLSLIVNGEEMVQPVANPIIPIVYYGGSPTDKYPLERCAGDCDDDDHCAAGYVH